MERITNYSVQEIDSQTQENDLKAARGKGWRGKIGSLGWTGTHGYI